MRLDWEYLSIRFSNPKISYMKKLVEKFALIFRWLYDSMVRI